MLLFCDGFESVSTASLPGPWTTAKVFESAVLPTGRVAGRSLQVNSSTEPNFVAYMTTEQQSFIVGFGLRPDISTLVSSNSIVIPILACTVSPNLVPHMALRWQPDCSISLDRYNVNQTWTNIARTPPNLIKPFVWSYVEFKCEFGTSAAYAVQHNGQQVLSGTGDTTGIGNPYPMTGICLNSPVAGGANATYDDCYIANGTGSAPTDFIGDVKIIDLRPGADGDWRDFAAFSGTSHYSMVNDVVTNDDLTFVTGGATGSRDTYFLEPLLRDFNPAVKGLGQTLLARKSDIGSRSIALLVRQSGTDLLGASISIGNSYQTYTQFFGVNPITNAPWTLNDLTTMQFGLELTV